MTQPVITDSHCHLDFPDFVGREAETVAAAHAAGVHRMVSICTKLRNQDQVRALSQAHPSIYWAVGTHPMSVADEPMVTLDALIKLADEPKMVGIGETGLDYHYTAQSAELQKESLRIHIQAAQQTGLPLIIHARDADDDIAKILEETWVQRPYSCVMHCFSSSADLARRCLDLGFYLSMSGIVAFPKSQALRDIFAAAPMDRVLVETDSPYLAPPPYRGKRNQPAYSVYTAEVGAKLFDMEYLDFAAQIEANFLRLFRKVAAYEGRI